MVFNWDSFTEKKFCKKENFHVRAFEETHDFKYKKNHHIHTILIH